MKKLFALFLSFVMLFSAFSTIAFATESSPDITPPTDEPVVCLMGDVDGDSVVSAADARTILRCAVSLETLEPNVLLRCDLDFSGKIDAPDARLALRTSVSLEEEVQHTFVIMAKQLPDCSNEGNITAKCNDCENELSLIVNKTPHDFIEIIPCAPSATCRICEETVTFDVLNHTFSRGKCVYCVYVDKKYMYDNMISFIRNNGLKQDGLYVYQEDKPECSYGLCYDSKDKSLYMVSGYYVTMEDTIVEFYTYIDIFGYFDTYSAEIDAYEDGVFVLYGVYDIAPQKLSLDAPGALSTKEFEPSDVEAQTKEQIKLTCEANVIDMMTWLADFFIRTGSPLDLDVMGFSTLNSEN